MRAITTATAAAVLSVDRKKLDNLLSRIGTDGFKSGRQGVERRIPVAMLEEIALTSELSARLAIPAKEAFALARQLLGRDTPRPLESGAASGSEFVGSLNLGPFVHLGADLHSLRAELHTRLEAAIESQVRPRRGRPRKPRPRQPNVADPVDE